MDENGSWDSDGSMPIRFTGKDGAYHYSSDGQNATTTLVTSRFGKLHVTGLPAGRYMLHETKAPAGFRPVDTPFTLDGAMSSTTLHTTIVDEMITFTLPESGGHGTLPYSVGGLLLIIAAACLLYIHTKRRRGDSTA